MQLFEEIRSAYDEFMSVSLAKAARVGAAMLFVQHLAIHFLEMRVCPRSRDEVIVHPFRGSAHECESVRVGEQGSARV